MNDIREIVFETSNWGVILTADQSYIGRCVVYLKRKCGDLADLTQDEILDFHELVKKLQGLLKETFDATKFDWSCLMNTAYLETPPNPQVHWHFRPRYNHMVGFGGLTFDDPNFGHNALRGNPPERLVGPLVLAAINKKLQENL